MLLVVVQTLLPQSAQGLWHPRRAGPAVRGVLLTLRGVLLTVRGVLLTLNTHPATVCDERASHSPCA